MSPVLAWLHCRVMTVSVLVLSNCLTVVSLSYSVSLMQIRREGKRGWMCVKKEERRGDEIGRAHV